MMGAAEQPRKGASLRERRNSAREWPLLMSNRALWNVRMRHEWLATPLKGKRLKKRKRARIGMDQARDRQAAGDAEPTPSAS